MTNSDYAELTSRNTGLVSASVQQRLRRTTVLVAGVGSTGGAVIEPLARIGVGALILAEPGDYELSNLNRQQAYRADIGANKAATAARRVAGINPDCALSVHTDGVTPDNVGSLLDRATIVVDGVDVTTRAGWAAKLAVHRGAAQRALTVISGWDLACSQYVRLYRYGSGQPVLDGITADLVETLPVWSLIKRVLPSRVFPDALADDIAVRGGREPEYHVPQLIQTAMLFGAIATQIVVDHAGQVPGPDEILVDLQHLTTGVPSVRDGRAGDWYRSLP
ncbi:HesA/MoeB/ThiF family protein [Mycolicibacterium litorale]|uniref:HesA/MoeB/ThiF family protein n=1 Tax=Mycolicibacterium litorale TaxID=758802 RepID=UPI003CF9990F